MCSSLGQLYLPSSIGGECISANWFSAFPIDPSSPRVHPDLYDIERGPENIMFTRGTSIGSFNGLEIVLHQDSGTEAKIGGNAFFGYSRLKKIVFAQDCGVISIGEFAFYRCENLTDIEFIGRSQLEAIEKGAISGCPSLRILRIPASVTNLGYCCFAADVELIMVEFEAGSQLNKIDEFAFLRCSSLEEVCVPKARGKVVVDPSAFLLCLTPDPIVYRGE
jgi:hypothetical protein